MRFISKRAIAAVGIAVGLCIAGPATGASASIPVLHAGNGDVAHQCVVIGRVYPEEAVVCVDMRTSLVLGDPVVDAYGELFCQMVTDGSTLPCLEAQMYGTLATATGGAGPRYQRLCVGSDCSAGRNTWFIGAMTFPTSNCQTSLSNNAWAVLYGQGFLTSILLADSPNWMYLAAPSANDSGNESTGHFQICP